MKIRPWPIVILALAHILAPIGNLLLSSWMDHLSVLEYLRYFFSTQGVWSFIDFFVLLPIGGIAIFQCKRWSYPVFLAISLENLLGNYLMWREQPWIYHFWFLILLVVLDLFFVGYFLIPGVRLVYLDPRMRWWESKPRFLVRVRCSLTAPDGTRTNAVITDISEGGVFVKVPKLFAVKDQLKMEFRLFSKRYELLSTVQYVRSEGGRGCGLQFQQSRDNQKGLREVKRLMQGFHVAGFHHRNYFNWRADLREWLVRLFKTGKGLVPQSGRR